MSGHYSCDNVWLQCYDNQSAENDYMCRKKLEQFYTTGEYCLQSAEKHKLTASASSNVTLTQDFEPRDCTDNNSSITHGNIDLIKKENQSALNSTCHSISLWYQCRLLLRGLMGYRMPLNDFPTYRSADNSSMSTNSR